MCPDRARVVPGVIKQYMAIFITKSILGYSWAGKSIGREGEIEGKNRGQVSAALRSHPYGAAYEQPYYAGLACHLPC